MRVFGFLFSFAFAVNKMRSALFVRGLNSGVLRTQLNTWQINGSIEDRFWKRLDCFRD